MASPRTRSPPKGDHHPRHHRRDSAPPRAKQLEPALVERSYAGRLRAPRAARSLMEWPGIDRSCNMSMRGAGAPAPGLNRARRADLRLPEDRPGRAPKASPWEPGRRAYMGEPCERPDGWGAHLRETAGVVLDAANLPSHSVPWATSPEERGLRSPASCRTLRLNPEDPGRGARPPKVAARCNTWNLRARHQDHLDITLRPRLLRLVHQRAHSRT